MQSTESSTELTNESRSISFDELHERANQYICESNQLIFKKLPAVISQILEHEVWKKRNNSYRNFGEYALNQTSDGLGITNNEMLWLLRSAMDINTQHAAHWGDVLGEVDTHVRTYAKEKKIPIRELNRDLTDQEDLNPELSHDNTITYLPSRSRSVDGQLLKLKTKDPQAYEHVIQGKIKLKDAFPQVPRKKLQPIESVKNKFTSLSKSDREAFLAWLEQEKEHLV